MSFMRRAYIGRFYVRCLLLLLTFILFFTAPQQFSVLGKGNFFQHFSFFHILWCIWVLDMLQQLFPVKGYVALGSQKLFKSHFQPLLQKINRSVLRAHIIETTKNAYKVFLLWAFLIAGLGFCYGKKLINDSHLLLCTVIFYVCDLICVLFWCPFRHFIMKNRCCTTCRIFNWDHLMMFSPLLFVKGFFARSLLLISFVVFLVWELVCMIHPERFWDGTNARLTCAECTDKLCGQNCKKLKHR